MKSEFNFLELRHMVGELQVLVGARLNKVYEPDGVLLQFHKSGEGKFLLRIHENLLWLTARKPEMPERISGFCAKVRKHLVGKKVEELVQVGSERIVRFRFETQKETYFLFVELFGKGNVVLTDAALKILAATEEHTWKDREVRRGVVYELPPQKESLFELEALPSKEKELAMLGLGKLLAKEVLARGGGLEAYRDVLAAPFSPRRYADGTLSPIKLEQYGEQGKKADSFSALIDDAFMREQGAEEAKPAALSRLEKKRKKVLDVIKMQEQAARSLEKKADEAQRKGELVYEHFQELQEVLDAVKEKKSASGVSSGHVKAKRFTAKTGDVSVEIEK